MATDKIYSGRIDLSVANNSHTKLCERILEACPGGGKRVLDVGCSEGYLGEALKGFGFEVWGIEPSANAASTARKRLDKVFVGGLEDFLSSHSPTEIKFDYVVFGDVLEHLPDAVTILARCREFLAPGGAVAASIPNIAHLATRLMLLQGQWTYDDFGLMDHTHLHFFTRRSIVDLFTQAGFRVESLDTVELPFEHCGIEVEPALVAWGKAAIKDPDARVFQFVAFAHSCSAPDAEDVARFNARLYRPSLPSVLALVPFFELGLASIRLLQPLSAWSRRYGGHVRIIKFADLQEHDLEGIDVAIVQRIISPSAVSLIRQMQRRGIKVLFDIDDLLTEMPPFLASSAAMTKAKPILEHTLRIVDGITVATPRLQKRLASYNRCHVTPNCPSPALSAPVQSREENGRITLLMASSDSVRFDFIVPVLKALLNDTEFRIRLVAIGPPAEYLAAEGLPVERHPTMDYAAFRAFAASLPDALGVIPLDDSPFSACKSAIKFMDYALAGIPSVCSAIPPYSDVVIDGETGLLAKNTAESWLRVLKHACGSASVRHTLARNARRQANEAWSINLAADAWQEVIAALVSEHRPLRQRIILQPEKKRSSSHFARRWRRLKAIGIAIDMEGGWLPFSRKILSLWQTEGWRGLNRRIGAFRSWE